MGILPNPLHLVTVTAFGAKLPLTGVVRNSSLWDVCQVNLLVVNGGWRVPIIPFRVPGISSPL
ncbi:hypothetical protein CDAR_233541, partial [Caerostris darwini]